METALCTKDFPESREAGTQKRGYQEKEEAKKDDQFLICLFFMSENVDIRKKNKGNVESA
ncbi:MAG: hypothetical protein V8S22_08235 [Lachnospiraceae bacterium]